MIKNKILLTACFALAAFVVKGQNVEGVSPVDGAALSSGTSSSAGSDIVNVDLYTGIGSATIPIYDYSLGDLNLGISLSYNMKGIEVDQTASSVGLGWNLNAGGEITRTINHFEDEAVLYHAFETDGSGNPDVFYVGRASVTAFSDPSIHHKDNAYDEYHINMAGRAVDMIWTSNWYNQVYCYPKSELSFRFITVSDDDTNLFDDYNSRSFPGLLLSASNSTSPLRLGIYIIDEKGNQFLYLPGDQEIKYYDFPSADPSPRWIVTKWVLSKVRSSNGNEVKFNYTRNYVSYTAAQTYKFTEYFFANGIAPPAPQFSTSDYLWRGYVSQLSSIEYPNGIKATLHWDTGANQRCDMPDHFIVDSITIESKYGQDVKNAITYKFNYSYFHAPTNNPSTEITYGTPCYDIETNGVDRVRGYRHLRLKLKSIDRVGNHTTSEKFYSFDYHRTPLPSRFSVQKDFYNYYNNGYSTNTPGVPMHLYNNNYGTSIAVGTDRTPDTTSNLTYMQAGLLNKITNGLGGTIEMQYAKPEMINPACQYGRSFIHPYECIHIDTLYPDGQDATDGLVVKSILLKDGISPDHDRLIEYNYGGGQRFFRGGYFWIPTEVYIQYGITTIRAKEYSNNMYSPRYSFNGSNHGFSNVTVIHKQNQTSEQLSKTEYEFSNLIFPDSLTRMYTKAFSDSVTNNPDKYYLVSRPYVGSSNTAIDQSLYSHTASFKKMDKFNMGLLLNKKEYNFNDEVIAEENIRYDVNFFRNITDSTQGRYYTSSTPFYYKRNDSSTFTLVSITTPITGGIARMRERTVTTKNDIRNHVVKYNYEYDNFDNVKSVKWNDSKGDIIETEKLYLYEHWNSVAHSILLKNMQHVVMERTLIANPAAPTVKFVFDHSVLRPLSFTQPCVFPSQLSDSLNSLGTWFVASYNSDSGDTYLETLKDMRELKKIRFPSVYRSTQTAATALNTAKHDQQNALTGSTGLATLRKAKEYTKFDCSENVLEMQLDELNRYNSFVWDSRYGHKIAEVNNARFDEVAYTGFEGLNEDTGCTTDYGNWNFSPSAVIYPPAVGGTTPQALTGKYIYNLNLANITTQLKPNTDYELTFWADIDPKVSINSSQQSLTLKRQGAWSLYSLKFTSGSSDVLTIEDNSSMTIVGFIDELRLYPAKATMTTYTYEPLFGISSVCDSRNNILYTEYDAQGRPTIVRDINHAIISKTDTRNQTNNN